VAPEKPGRTAAGAGRIPERAAGQTKLDELIRATRPARNTLLDIKELSGAQPARITARGKSRAGERISPLP
jgi:low affinity Fe/Cu permease